MEKKTTVSDAELEILEVLWEAGKALNASEIRSLLEKNKKWERTTVLTLIQRLVKKGMLAQEKREVYYYLPNVDRKDYVKEETRNFVNKFFKGKAGKIQRQGNPVGFRAHGSLDQRRLRQALLLVGDEVVQIGVILPVALHKVTVFINNLLLQDGVEQGKHLLMTRRQEGAKEVPDAGVIKFIYRLYHNLSQKESRMHGIL